MNNIQETRKLGQSIWLDYIRRGLIDSGELTRLIDLGITGLTANPTIMEKAIIGSSDYPIHVTWQYLRHDRNSTRRRQNRA